ncbi:MAG: putative toxin-antitoxin system toxin component, PIN family [Chloroflexi bacterium]|nr:putative toxin-antitoxin system toxin component, PIN family [Ardenticatenaceae bacterium]MBL1127112.1 putative toxin-antitoxin system toxin component, PIN family [Chloroflexota bacterium]NOG33172.1 putative toxin-antitoxin system toxin component, PIN family [Chloroflexota bacterium]GIK54967.1 MAG: putative toxin-antitoxin system toxin component, PIN family protein [Chloroflexota bacterium]
MPFTVVFDTNILFSALDWQGNPYRCLELARRGDVTAVTCPELMAELGEKLQTKLNFSDEMVTETIADLLGFLHLTPIPGQLQFITADPDDDVVLECALVSQADYIVSGDRRYLLPIGSFQGIKIVTAVDFLAIVAAAE